MAKKRSYDSRPKVSTLGLDDIDETGFSGGDPVEYEPTEYAYEEQDVYEESVTEEYDSEIHYAKAERVLTIATSVLGAMLLLGSIAFWWYFVSRLSACPISIVNWKLYPAMLICCAAVTLAYSVSEIMRRLPVSVENWMVNICISGAVSAVIMILFNTFTLGNEFSWMDTVTILCFAVSGCALPAAVYTALRGIAGGLLWQIEREKAVDSKTLYADINAQCEGRF